jgi:DNA-binding CsgD family transcriptional regulator
MYKTKSTRKPKSYWDMLIKEVATKNHPPNSSPPPPVGRVTYDTQYERRSMKYALGEPLPSTYFTQREAECVMQILQGKTLNEVGDILNLSPRTVEYYLGKIKRKLNCRKKKDIIKLVGETDFVKNFEKDPYNSK